METFKYQYDINSIKMVQKDTKQQEDNPLVNELKKFCGQKVTVYFKDDSKITGKIKVINYMTGLIVLMTENHKYIVPPDSIHYILRERDTEWSKSK